VKIPISIHARMQKKFTETMKHCVIVMKSGHVNVQLIFNLGVWNMKFVLNEKVFILTKYDENEYDSDNILGVFKTKESAEAYRNEYIRESYSIEDDIPDADLEKEVTFFHSVEFNIENYWVNP
jgi:hypothetical protein